VGQVSERAPRGAKIKISLAAAWVTAGAIAIMLALMWAAHTAPLPRAGKRAQAAKSRPVAAEPTAAHAPASAVPAPPAGAPAQAAKPEAPIRDDLVIYYLADVQGEIEPCG